MKTNAAHKNEYLVRRHLEFVAALLVAASLFVGCAGGGSNTGVVNNTNTAPATTQAPAAQPTPLGIGDKPIIISGGSLEIDFDHSEYERPAAGGNTFNSSGNKLTEVLVYDDEAGTQGEPIPIRGTDQNPAVIEIWGRHRGTDVKVVDIKEGRGGSVSITFTHGDFTPDGTRRHYKSRRHYSKNHQLIDVRLRYGNSSDYESLIRNRCRNKNKCTIDIGGYRPNQ